MIPSVLAFADVSEQDVGFGEELLHGIVFPSRERNLPQVQHLQGFADVGNGVGEHVERVAPRVDGGQMVETSDALGQLFEDVARDDKHAQVTQVADGLGQAQQLVVVEVEVLQFRQPADTLV